MYGVAANADAGDLMAKIDKSQYTKAEWKILKEQRRQEKRLKLLANTIES